MVEPVADFRDTYIATNMADWNSRVAFHEQGYDLHLFRDDPAHISSVVQFDLPRLGSIAGLDGVHLQCHIGSDTLLLARLGARVTGLDFSAPALDAARRLAVDCGESTTYVDHEGELSSPTTVSFNYGLGQIITALADAGMRLVLFEEHDSVTWNALDDEMVADEMGEYRLRVRPERLAASYTLRAVKDPSDTLTA